MVLQSCETIRPRAELVSSLLSLHVGGREGERKGEAGGEGGGEGGPSDIVRVADGVYEEVWWKIIQLSCFNAH